MNEYSQEAMMVLEDLSDKEIKQLKKENPFRIERNDKLRELAGRGVVYAILAEISGLGKSTIGRICKGLRRPNKQNSGENHVIP